MKNIRRKRTTLILHLLALIIVSFGFFPFVWLLSASFKSQQELYTTLPSLIPQHPVWTNYIYVLKGIRGVGTSGGGSRLLILYKNSIIVTLSSVALNLLVVSLAGYAFARLKFRGRDAFFYLFIILMFLPSGGTLMATYELMHAFHLLNSRLGLILLYVGGGGVPLFLMRQVFLNIPSQLEDAARVDGASNFRICFQIMMPLAAGGMVLVAIMQFVGVWGEYLLSRTLIYSADKMTLPWGVQTIITSTPASGAVSSYGIGATAITFLVIPTVLFFILLQKWFIRGAMEGLKM